MNEEKTLSYDFIANKIRDKSSIQIFLINGVKLQGTILNQDKESLIMTTTKANGDHQLVQKSAISTIS